MKAALVILAMVVLAAVAVDQLGDLTQTRSDRRIPGSRSEVILRVETRQPFKTSAESAAALWGACSGTVGHRLEPPGLVPAGENMFRLTVAPSLGSHARRRLRGCLDDTTLDRVIGRVTSIRTLAPPTP
jgi:hypothetical protein